MFQTKQPHRMQTGDHVFNNALGEIGVLQDAQRWGDNVIMVFQDRRITAKGDEHGWSVLADDPVAASSAQSGAEFKEDVAIGSQFNPTAHKKVKRITQDGEDDDMPKEDDEVMEDDFEEAGEEFADAMTGSFMGPKRSSSLMHQVGHETFHGEMNKFVESHGVEHGSHLAMYPAAQHPGTGMLPKPEQALSFFGRVYPKMGKANLLHADKNVDVKPAKYASDVYLRSPAAQQYEHHIGGQKYHVTVTPPGKTAKDLDPHTIAQRHEGPSMEHVDLMQHWQNVKTHKEQKVAALQAAAGSTRKYSQHIEKLHGEIGHFDAFFKHMENHATRDTSTSLASGHHTGSYGFQVEANNQSTKDRMVSHVMSNHPELNHTDAAAAIMNPSREHSPGPFGSAETKGKHFQGLMRPGTSKSASTERQFMSGMRQSEHITAANGQPEERALDVGRHAGVLTKTHHELTMYYANPTGYVTHAVKTNIHNFPVEYMKEYNKRGNMPEHLRKPFATIAKGDFGRSGGKPTGSDAYKHIVSSSTNVQKGMNQMHGVEAPGVGTTFHKGPEKTFHARTRAGVGERGMATGSAKTMVVGGSDLFGHDVYDTVHHAGMYRGGRQVNQTVTDYNQQKQKLFGRETPQKPEKPAKLPPGVAKSP